MSTPPPGYPHHPPPGYPPPRYGPPVPMPPGYGYPCPRPRAPGYGAPPPQVGPAFAPGIIPLRPLSLSDIFNGAGVYIRANPRATLGLTTVIVVITQIITLLGAIGPLAATNQMTTGPELTGSDIGAWMFGAALAGVVGWLAGTVLTGMLTVVAGRAIFGSTISVGETWAMIRGRLPSLIGLVALECVGLVLLAGGVGLIVAVIAAGSGVAAMVLGLPLVLLAVATVVYLYTVLSFAPVLIVLERLPVTDSIRRSVALTRNSFWRVLGIRVLSWLVVTLVSAAVAAPFNLLGQLAAGSVGIVAATIGAVGLAIGTIVTAPFSAGVVALLYTDRRIRSEAFDLVLRSGAAGGPFAADSTDYLWLTRPT